MADPTNEEAPAPAPTEEEMSVCARYRFTDAEAVDLCKEFHEADARSAGKITQGQLANLIFNRLYFEREHKPASSLSPLVLKNLQLSSSDILNTGRKKRRDSLGVGSQVLMEAPEIDTPDIMGGPDVSSSRRSSHATTKSMSPPTIPTPAAHNVKSQDNARSKRRHSWASPADMAGMGSQKTAEGGGGAWGVPDSTMPEKSGSRKTRTLNLPPKKSKLYNDYCGFIEMLPREYVADAASAKLVASKGKTSSPPPPRPSAGGSFPCTCSSVRAARGYTWTRARFALAWPLTRRLFPGQPLTQSWTARSTWNFSTLSSGICRSSRNLIEGA